MKLKAPFPYFGGKSRVADMVWERFHDPKNYVEPFAGSLAVLLSRPSWEGIRIETANDIDAYLTNFWRACARMPEVTAYWAEYPTSEIDLHARGDAVFYRGAIGADGTLRTPIEFAEKLRSDPEWFDPKIAGWWVWGISNWIGNNWSAQKKDLSAKMGVTRAAPYLAGPAGSGIARQMPQVTRARPNMIRPEGVARQRPRLCDAGGVNSHLAALEGWFSALAERLRHVRLCCGDWQRVMTDSVVIHPGTPTAIFLDPPYDPANCEVTYANHSASVSAEVREWAIAHGDDKRLRIALCGYEGEHVMPPDWECVEWKTQGGMSNTGSGESRAKGNVFKERIWFSPHCPKREGQMTFE